MYIKSLFLKNFRNYDDIKIDLSESINIIYGDNAQGKTNLLESIYVLGITKSHRSFLDNNLIKNGEIESSISGIINKNDIDYKHSIELGKNKLLKIDNDIIKKNSDYISNLNIIIFYPDDLDLIKGSPNIRRHFLNIELSQLYNNYYIIFNEYSKLLKMRNDYLKQINNNFDKNYFYVLNNYLIEKAIMVYKMRKKFVDKINIYVEKIYKDISNIENFNVKYKTSYDFEKYDDEYLRNKLQELFLKNFDNDIKYKTTTIGPHKDDLEFYIGNMNLKIYGSQGQQRMAVLSLKLAEIEIFKKYKKDTPILLLDDVFSELDDIKKNNLLKYIDEKIQTIITTTDLNNMDKKIIEKSKLINIKDGKIQ